MKQFLIGPVLAALAMFVWGFIYWGVPHHLPYKSLSQVPDYAAAADALDKIFPTTGAYLLPDPRIGETNVAELMKRGPYAQVVIRKGGMEMMDPSLLGKGYLHMLVLAILLSALLCGLEKSFERWTCRVKFSAGIGFFVAVAYLGNSIWWHYPWGWTLANSFYYLVLFAIGGLVLAKFVTPKPASKN